MNKKILMSYGLILAVAAIVAGGTYAYFSDTETSTGNTFAAGSLDLSVNGVNGEDVGAVVTISDMKPCQTRYSDPITLHVSNNPGKLYKRIEGDFDCITEDLTEPECTEQGGIWHDDAPPGVSKCEWLGNQDDNYIPKDIWFDLEVWAGPNDPPTVAGEGIICDGETVEDCWEIIIPDGKITVEEISDKWIYFGTYGEYLPEGNEITIRQSFHMDAEAGNEYQGDKCTFSEEFMVEQENAPYPLEVVNTDTEVHCDDKVDNDLDGLEDCVDPDCFDSEWCEGP